MTSKKKLSGINREALQALRKSGSFLRRETVEVPEWNGCVGIRQMSIQEKVRAFSNLKARSSDQETTLEENVEYMIALLTCCLVDPETGEQLLEEGDDFLHLQPEDLMTRLVTEALKVNGMSSEALDELKKKANEDQSGNSASG